ncbi:MAG: RlmE family RNA methyltransferase [Proteobacteria bacterium]|nr:RlmE family RNA methyltransferase [Pseudomonadota bacterium]MBU1737308.1 RlmE family RNA methyltransferase [Pseudomonadota bacterium]
MKEVQDHYFRKAKKDGYPARSVYKLEEAQNKYRFLTKGGRILDLGCFPGSWSMFASRVVGPSGLVVGVDLNKVTAENRQPGAGIKWLVADIFEDGTVDLVRAVSASFTAVISDMAPRTTGNKWADQQKSLDLSRRALELAVSLLDPDGAFYCKVFEGEDYKDFFNEVKACFRLTRTVKPKSSRPESREVFVLGIGLKK